MQYNQLIMDIERRLRGHTTGEKFKISYLMALDSFRDGVMALNNGKEIEFGLSSRAKKQYHSAEHSFEESAEWYAYAHEMLGQLDKPELSDDPEARFWIYQACEFSG